MSKLVRIAPKAAVTTRILVTAAETTHLAESFLHTLAESGCVLKHCDEACSARNIVVKRDLWNVASWLGVLRSHSGRSVLKGEHVLNLSVSGKLKSQDFDTRKHEDDFFRWSAIRPGFLSEASVDQARIYVGVGPGWCGPNWYGASWYWDPRFFVYTFLPADGIFYSPFGWGFYSPIFVYLSPFFYYGLYDHRPHRFGDFHYTVSGHAVDFMVAVFTD